jgi:hypothetical protein
MIPAEAPKVRFNEKLDHLQARRPFTYNLVTGLIIGLVLLLLGASWWFALVYAPFWAALRWFLWRDGRILRRQYEARQVRVAAEKEAKRRQR